MEILLSRAAAPSAARYEESSTDTNESTNARGLGGADFG
jgi:hypothetical protein